jgi:RimJ/RimL family protein N-acetyltransferase
MLSSRRAQANDYSSVVAAIPQWWGGRDLSGLLQPLFFEHFGSTSLIAEDAQGLAAFLIGFDSPDEPSESYVHFVGVRPDLRGTGMGREMYEDFARNAMGRGIRTIRCVTSPVNTNSVAFHQHLGFTISGTSDEYVQLEWQLEGWPEQPLVDQATWPWSSDLNFAFNDITLAPFKEDDVQELFAALDDDAVWTHVRGRPQSADELSTTMDAAMSNGRWPLVVRMDGRIVGTTSFLELSTIDARCEIGFTLYAREVWGGPVNPTCKLLMMQWAFEECGMNRVQLKTDLHNLRSQNAIAKLGAAREGVLRGYQRRANDTIRDTVMYSVLATEWPQVKNGLTDRLRP